jgi:hypothetical protein
MADVPVASAVARPRSIGGRLNSAPGHAVNTPVDKFDAVIASHESGLLAKI